MTDAAGRAGAGGVWIDDRLVPAGDAVVPYDDHGLTVGDGAFETIKLVGEAPFALTRHLRRLGRSLAALRLPAPPEARIREAVEAVAAGNDGEAFLRVTVTGGQGPLGSPRDAVRPRLIVAIRSGSVRTDPTAVVVAPWTRNEQGALAGVKSTSYAENVVALALAGEAGATEALFANTAGRLCEGTGSNVFVVVGGRLVTPPLSSGCLAGVNRELLLEAMVGEAVEADVTMAELRAAPEAFLTSTAREVQPISAIDGVAMPVVGGPWTTRAREVWLTSYGPGTPTDP